MISPIRLACALAFSFSLFPINSTFAAETNAPAAPARRPQNAPVLSPVIEADRKVTFRIRAPKATEVAVQGQWKDGRAAMAKGANDVWSVTVGPVDPGVWEYSFNVDGVSMIDPANTWIKPMREPRTSILHVLGDKPLVWDFQDVPHGAVSQHTYRSKSLGRLRELAVYTPPGYNKSSKTYPLLVLQHGSGDNQATWVAHGKAHWIIDNLIASGKAEPMVIVMLDGHAISRRCAAVCREKLPRQIRRQKSRHRRLEHGRRAIPHHRPQSPGPIRLGRRLQLRDAQQGSRRKSAERKRSQQKAQAALDRLRQG
jgi:enterochelin esterase family protein